MKDESTAIYDVTYKIIVIGDRVGKSSLIQRYTKNTFSDFGFDTVGIEILTKDLSIDNKLIRIQIMDSSSNSQFKGIAKNYLKNVHGVVLVFDLTNKQSFESLNNWIKLVKENIHNSSCMILVGNKLDLRDNVEVSSDIARNKANSIGVEYIETSAKTNVNVDTIFESLTITIFNVFGVKEKHDLRKKDSIDNNSDSNTGSCQIQ